ncbi:hypothetical protein [Loigolactobacillus jiayinensis]|uniref:DUF3188 domain-containing protein n=1 Tax=Loigolactobacillus jiayinensis TaxID=2486016 RepID=A0ABW1RCC9_9LACO|nr:hypothetical protein [Loigolactobacillus jiayinensis]
MKKRGLLVMSIGFLIVALSPIGAQRTTNYSLVLVGISIIGLGYFEFRHNKQVAAKRGTHDGD